MRMNDWYTGQARVWARGLYVGVVALGIALSAGTGAEAQRLTRVALPNSDDFQSSDISADGRVVVGTIVLGQNHAFRWIRGVGLQILTPPEDIISRYRGAEGLGVSGDGSVAVGTMRYSYLSGVARRAFRWTEAGALVFIEDDEDIPNEAHDISADGSLIVGAYLGDACLWRDGSRVPLGIRRSIAYSVSADGSAVAGITPTSFGWQAFRWTEQTGIQVLGNLPGHVFTQPLGISVEGRVVVGWSRDSSFRWQAFVWQNGVMQTLSTPTIRVQRVRAVSSDGSIVVGNARLGENGEEFAFRWTASSGIQDLNAVYGSLLEEGERLRSAQAISPDGRFIVVDGRRNEPYGNIMFIIDTKFLEDVDGSGCVDMSDVWYIFIRLINGIACPECDANGDGVANFADAGHVFNYVNDPSKPKCWR